MAMRDLVRHHLGLRYSAKEQRFVRSEDGDSHRSLSLFFEGTGKEVEGLRKTAFMYGTLLAAAPRLVRGNTLLHLKNFLW